jgi:hypothetical protein
VDPLRKYVLLVQAVQVVSLGQAIQPAMMEHDEQVRVGRR